MKIFDKLNDDEIFIKTLNASKISIFYCVIFSFFSFFPLLFILDFKFVFIIFFIILLLNILIYYLVILKNALSKVLITNFRIIYLSKNNFIDYIENDIYLENILEFKIKKEWFLQNTFWYWNLEIILKDKTIILNNIKNIEENLIYILSKIKK